MCLESGVVHRGGKARHGKRGWLKRRRNDRQRGGALYCRERDPMLHVPSCDNLSAMGGSEPDNSAHSGVKDVTKPGLPMSRTKPMRLTEQLGGFPLIWNSILNRGEL